MWFNVELKEEDLLAEEYVEKTLSESLELDGQKPEIDYSEDNEE